MYKTIEELVTRVDERNSDGIVSELIGVSIDKCFIKSVANTNGTDLSKYKIIRKNDFAVSLMQVSRDGKIPVARLEEYEEAIMSPAYPIFRVKDKNILLPEYLEMWFKRPEFDREAAFIAVALKTNNYDWMPPAIKFLVDQKNDSDYILWFIRKLERLASYLLVTAQDVNHRMDRYKWILVEMESRPDNSMSAPLVNIELTDWEKQQFIEALKGDVYSMTAQRRNYIIQRLDSFVSDGGATYNTKIFTIEHVLPQHPGKDSEWMKIWPDVQQQKYWLNKIANLVPLTRQRNSAAQNYDFDIKKVKYFQSKNGTTSYTLTTQVINVDEWTPRIVESRQKYLEDVFTNKWDIKISKDDSIEDPVYKLAGRGGSATGYLTTEVEFVVMKGSRVAAKVTDGFQAGYMNLRNELITDGVIVDNVFVKI